MQRHEPASGLSRFPGSKLRQARSNRQNMANNFTAASLLLSCVWTRGMLPHMRSPRLQALPTINGLRTQFGLSGYVKDKFPAPEGLKGWIR